MKIDAYINSFLRWYLTKTRRVCGNCEFYDAENNKCKFFNCCWSPNDFCTKWWKRGE